MKNIPDISFLFSVPIQIKMCDLDPFVHVNNGVQCNYFDYGRAQYFEHVLATPIDWTVMDLVLVNIQMDFLSPVKIHDKIICETAIYEIGNKSIKMVQQLRCSQTNIIKTRCYSVLVGFDRKTEQSILINDHYRQCFSQFESLSL